MKQNIINSLIILCLVLSLIGCSATVFQNSVALSTKGKACNNFEDTNKKVSYSKSNVVLFLVLNLSTVTPKKLNEGFIKELENTDEKVAIDVQFNNRKFFWFFPIIIVDTWTIEGNLAKAKGNKI